MHLFRLFKFAGEKVRIIVNKIWVEKNRAEKMLCDTLRSGMRVKARGKEINMSKFEGFQCVVCGSKAEPVDTGFRPRDNKNAFNVKCAECGHNQIFPYMTMEEYSEAYNEGTTFKSEEIKIAEGADVETARIKWKEWNAKHIEMYYDRLQQHRHVLDLGSGFGFFEETLNQMKGNHFTIEGVEIGQYRLDAYVGGGSS